MAVKVSQFFTRYRNNTIAFFILVQIFITAVAGAASWIAGQSLHLEPLALFMVCLSIFLLFEVVATILVVTITSKPLKILSQAIAHVSDDPIQTPPPDISARQFSHSGLKDMVQTVYELAVARPDKRAIAGKKIAADNYLTTIFNNAPCGIIALDAEGQVVAANLIAPAHKTADDSIDLELLFEQSNSLEQWLADCRANKVRDTKTWQRIADRVPGEDGRRIFDVIAYYNKDGKQGIETILITVDRTTLYAPADEDMDFIALAAHELRGPITVIRGYLDLLDEELGPQLNPDKQVLIDRLQVSAEQLSGYINNILNVSRYDRNHLRLHLHEMSLIAIIKNLIPDLALRAKTKKRRLSFHIPSDLATIAADPSSLSEVLSNLIDNAIKYSKEEGEVVVSAVQKGNFIEITVQDFGIGMPSTVVGNLFTKFYRSHRSRQQVGGTGLGLYICKAIVESHGGSIWARAKEGEGSTFGFTVPIYSTVADRLGKDDNGNEHIIERADGWIKNHAMYRR